MRLERDQLVELAELVTEQLAARLQAGPNAARGGALVDAQAVADRLGVSRDFVYAHAAELGGRQIGDGARPRWRFDLEAAVSCSAGRQSEVGSSAVVEPIRARRRRRALGTSVELLPVRGGQGV